MTILRASQPCSLPWARPAHGHARPQPGTAAPRPRTQLAAGADPKRVRSSARLDELAAAADAAGLKRASAAQVDAAPDAFPWLSGLAVALLPLLAAGPALAYDREGGEAVLKNVAGAAYALLVCVFFVRLFRRRAKSGTSQSLRSLGAAQAAAAKDAQKPRELKQATPVTALWGAVQAGVIAYLLFQVCGYVDGYFDRQELPDQYTARNIAVTLKTIVRGLAYLITFLFGANALGLAGLSVQLALYPDSLSEGAAAPEEGKAAAADEPKLPSNGPPA